MTKKGLKTVSLDKVIDKYIGKNGTAVREAFEHKLGQDLLDTKKRKTN